jgi:hypothetical protein
MNAHQKKHAASLIRGVGEGAIEVTSAILSGRYAEALDGIEDMTLSLERVRRALEKEVDMGEGDGS